MNKISSANIEFLGNKDKYFKGQQKYEDLIFATRKHWIILVPYTLSFILTLSIASILIWTLFSANFATKMQTSWIFQLSATVGIIMVTYFFHKYFNRILNYYLDVIIITNYRIILIEKSLFLKDEKDVIDLQEITDIKKSQLGILKRLFDYGEIIISQSGSDNLQTLKYVAFPDHFFRKVNLAKRNYMLDRRQGEKIPDANNYSITNIPSSEQHIYEEQVQSSKV